MIDTNTVAILSAVFTFVATVIASLITWNKSNKDEKMLYRADIFKHSEQMRVDMDLLRKRVDVLEAENSKHTRTVSALETQIEKIRAALYAVLDVDLDEVLMRYQVHIRNKQKPSEEPA